MKYLNMKYKLSFPVFYYYYYYYYYSNVGWFVKQRVLTQGFHFQVFSCCNDVQFICIQYLHGSSVLGVCVCVCVCALDCVSCSEGLRFCDLFSSYMQLLSRTLWLWCKDKFCLLKLHMRNFYLFFMCFPFTHKGKHTKTIEKFHICNLSTQNLYLHVGHTVRDNVCIKLKRKCHKI